MKSTTSSCHHRTPIDVRSFRQRIEIIISLLVVLACAMIPYICASSSGTETIDSLMDRLEKDVLLYRDVVQGLLSDTTNTTCSWLSSCMNKNYEHCKSEFPSSTCIDSPADNPLFQSACYDSYKCQTKLDYTVSSIRLSDYSLAETTPTETKMKIYESICKTVSLDTWFHEYYYNKSIETTTKPLLMHFGTQQGMHRMYPASYGEDLYPGQCKPYDPTIRPWYSGASSARRNLILLIDITMNIGNRFTNMQKMIARVVDATTIADNIAIILFNSTTSTLLNLSSNTSSNTAYGFYPATILNKKDIKQKMSTLVSDAVEQVPNYTLAFQDVLRLLQDPSVDCSTAIMLYTDKIQDTMDTINAIQSDLANTETNTNSILLFVYLMSAQEVMYHNFTCNGPTFRSGLWSTITDESDIVNGLAPYFEIFQTALEQQQNVTSSGTNNWKDYVAWSEPYPFFEFGVTGVTVSAPMYDAQGQLIGVVGIDHSQSGLQSALGYSENKILERAKRQQDVNSCPNFRNLQPCAFRFDQRNVPNLLCSAPSSSSSSSTPSSSSLSSSTATFASLNNNTNATDCATTVTIFASQPSSCCANGLVDCMDIKSSSKLWNNVRYEGENYTERGCCTSAGSGFNFITSPYNYSICILNVSDNILANNNLTNINNNTTVPTTDTGAMSPGVIAGCVVGSIVLVAASILGFVVYRRRQCGSSTIDITDRPDPHPPNFFPELKPTTPYIDECN